jgi:hypothetical protein
MKRFKLGALLLGLALGAAAVAGCGSSGIPAAPVGSTTPTPVPSATPAP